MGYDSILGDLGTYMMNMSALGSYNNMAPMGYLPYSNVFSNVLGTLYTNGLSTQEITGFRTIAADSALQKELSKLGYGNMMILVPESYQKQVEGNEENARKIGETFKKWKANYDTANAGRSKAQSSTVQSSTGNQVKTSTGNQGRASTSVSHDHPFGNCAFGRRV